MSPDTMLCLACGHDHLEEYTHCTLEIGDIVWRRPGAAVTVPLAALLNVGALLAVHSWALLSQHLVLAWGVLGQAIAGMQLVGALMVVSAVVWLGLRKG